MALRNCSSCQRIFDSFAGARSCQRCLEENERNWQAVRDYVKGHPNCAVEDVCEATGVREEKVREFIRSGLLESRALSDATTPCRTCHAPIVQGEYCAACKTKLGNKMQQSLDSAREPLGGPKPGSGKQDGNYRGAFVTDFRKNRKIY